jgi:alkanesulfonate monooxygenase SsuD/methylene tetrahydromethanopterin reductase-like flavin-dependent oxidoreductase (luciferase family)
MRAPSGGAAPTLRFALRYDPRPTPDIADASDVYGSILEHAVSAEAHGVDLVWISERPFVRGARLPAALPLCAALAARTQRLRIGVGPLALPLYHPLRVAEDAATLDGLSNGRIELALGLGGADQAFSGFGISSRGRGDRLEEGFALVRAAWTGEAVTFAGRHHTVSGVAVSPRPTQRPGPPLWVGAGTDTAVRRAARLGAGLLALEPDAIPIYLEARRRLGELAQPARVALELDAPALLRGPACDTLKRLLEASAGAQVFDLVVCVESSGGGLLAGDEIDALLALRGRLAAGG